MLPIISLFAVITAQNCNNSKFLQQKIQCLFERCINLSCHFVFPTRKFWVCLAVIMQTKHMTRPLSSYYIHLKMVMNDFLAFQLRNLWPEFPLWLGCTVPIMNTIWHKFTIIYSLNIEKQFYGTILFDITMPGGCKSPYCDKCFIELQWNDILEPQQ